MIPTDLKITAETKVLGMILSSVGNIVDKNNPKPVLNNIKLEAGDSTLMIYATDLDISIRASISTQVIKTGEVTVSGKLLNDIIKKIPDAEVTLEYLIERDQLAVKTSSCEFILSTLPVKEFPILEYFEYQHKITIKSKDLLNLIESTAFSMSYEETRYNLNGVFIHKNMDGFLEVAATDCHRLALVRSNDKIDSDDFGIIIPKKTTDEVVKLLKITKFDEITLEVSPRLIKFTIGNVILTSKIIDGIFPEYNNFLPKNNENILIIDAKILADAIDRVSTINHDKFKAVKLNINSVGIEVWSFGQFKDAAKESILLENSCSYSGENLTVGFNPKYLLDILRLFGSELCIIKFKDAFSSVLIEKHNVSNYQFVVMPIKV